MCTRSSGVGGAFLAATTLSLLTSTYNNPQQRRRALGTWSATVSGGAAAGILLGGVVTAELGWRWIFVLSAAIALGTFLLTLIAVASPMAPGAGRTVDLLGGGLVTVGLALVVCGMIESRTHGWLSIVTIAIVAGGLGGLGLFWAHERTVPDPLLPVGLLLDRRRAGANVATALVGCNLYFLYFAISLYLQRVEHYGPLRAGVLSLPAALAVVGGSLSAPYIARRVSPRRQLVTAMVLIALGFSWLSRLGVDGAYWNHLGGPLIVIGTGLGASFVPATIVATAGVPVDRAGVASGMVNSSRQIGRAVGLALLTGLAVSGLESRSPARIAVGESHAFVVCALIAAVGVPFVLMLFHGTGAPEGSEPLGQLVTSGSESRNA